jgi:hypothetical protein
MTEQEKKLTELVQAQIYQLKADVAFNEVESKLKLKLAQAYQKQLNDFLYYLKELSNLVRTDKKSSKQ